MAEFFKAGDNGASRPLVVACDELEIDAIKERACPRWSGLAALTALFMQSCRGGRAICPVSLGGKFKGEVCRALLLFASALETLLFSCCW